MDAKIKKTLNAGESETVEFKTSFDKDAIETLTAFANTKGGRVFIGVSDEGKIKGINLGKETVQSWINQVRQFTSQAIIPDIETVKINDKAIVILSVQEAPIKPVACKGRYYKRVKNANHQLSASEVATLHLSTFNTSWDFHIDEHHMKKDVSLKKVRVFIRQVNTNREMPIQDDPLTALEKFELIRNGKITYACFLLFMAEESSLSTIELGRFQTPIIIKDDLRLKTDLFAEVEGVMEFVRKHINKAIIVTGRPQHEERWDYPLDAIREIVINSIIHRDYSSSQDSVVKVYDDKIEFFNPGGLPAGLTVKKLLRGNYVSNARNKKIADAFKAAGLIEKYGSGIKRILDAFRAYGLPMPKFEEISGGFMVTAFKKTEEVGIKSEPSRHQVGTKSGVESGVESEMAIQLLRFLNKNLLSKKELAHRLGKTKPSRYLNDLMSRLITDGFVQYTIPDKPNSRLQKYRLTSKGKKALEKLKK